MIHQCADDACGDEQRGNAGLDSERRRMQLTRGSGKLNFHDDSNDLLCAKSS